ncbi:SOS response-associated peptidase family protein [Arthrobacter sp. NA-172]|uniref:SOS response-associated peptidase family protein n=1 Tax=Arthrobacter sp. NA-172 TaxID=3367524 RepID=UPI0037549EEE
MCGRFSVGFEADYLSRKLGAVLRGDTDYPSPTLQINPTDPVAFLRGRARDGTVGRELAAGRWGLVPTFSKSFDSKVPTWNARSETAGGIPTFKASLPKWRAVVPAYPVPLLGCL